MSQCPNGGQVAPGAPASFWAGGIPFVNWVASKWPSTAALLEAVWPSELLITSDFCTTEPVIPSPPSLLTLAAATRFDWTAIQEVLAYLRASYLSSVWPNYCQCAPGGSPAGSLEAYIDSVYAPINFWKYADAPATTNAHDSGTSNSADSMFNTYAFNTPKILPNAAGACVSTTGGAGNIQRGGASALDAQVGQVSFVAFFHQTVAAQAYLWAMYDGSHNEQLEFYVNSDGTPDIVLIDTANTLHEIYNAGVTVPAGSTHLLIVAIDWAARTARAYVDNGVLVGTQTLTANSYWAHAQPMYTQINLSLGHGFTGQSQDWFITRQYLGQADAQALYFQAGLGGGPVYRPILPATDPNGIVAGPPSYSASSFADVAAALTDIENKLDNIARYGLAASSSSIAFGTPIAGLTNSGVVDIAGMIGAEVTFTTIPPGWGRTTEVPPRYIPQLGNLQLKYASAGPWAESMQLHYSPQAWFFNAAGAKSLSYSFRPGVHATITPIVRGP